MQLHAPGAEPVVRSSRRAEFWLAIHLPCVVLDSLREAVAKLPGQPSVAVVDLERDGKVVCACDERAAAAGVTPGMALNSALALLPGLQTLSRNLQRERALLEAAAQLGLGFTPRVSLESPDAVLLEVRGSLRLFGGARALCEQVREELQSAGITGRLALTPTPLASLWFARAGQEVALRCAGQLPGRLAPLPLAVTRWPERSLQLLVTMGVRNLGDCLRLPRDGFARRFEPRLLTMLDRATGRLPDPRSAFRARERFAARRDLEPELADTQRLEVVCLPLLDELCAFLRQRGRGVQSIDWRFVHRTAPVTRLRLRFVEPVGEAGRIAHVFRERLARLELPGPVRTVRLASGPLAELPVASTELFAADRRESGATVPQLVERLRARLGVEAVHGLCLVPEHRPESTWRTTEPGTSQRRSSPAVVALSKPADATTVTWRGALRPLWLLEEPQPLAGDDRPRYQGTLELEEGPECIESGWWDGKDIARDYYSARNASGARFWVFRERRRRGEQAAGGWFLHGVFG
ncbi:MAG: DNA polymerase Y family protein [Gammaproteobacteria bacterium]|nr:DNA polymerase Y family protein [Gammaproteobacteria bacterium]MDH5272499.1 DNA polymerase Y family protein [Gammaproteobacteria bacterium]